MPVNAKNAHRVEAAPSMAGKPGKPAQHTINTPIGTGREMTEEEKLQALLNENDQSWRAEQDSMSHKPVVLSSYNKSVAQQAVPDKPLPPSYICHRCGEKGHWIQACPTNNDPNFDGRPKFKRTTGIPRSFLKVVEKPTDFGEDGSADSTARPKGVMYTANGEWVVAEPDNATWEKIQEKQIEAAAQAKDSASGQQELRDRDLECEIHVAIYVDPVKTPCCDHTYCNNCIEGALLDHDLQCPNCGTQPVLLDSLVPDDETAARIKAYEDEKKAEKALKAKESVGTPSATGELSAEAATKANGDETSSATSTPAISKKRAADGELPNDRKPANPAAATAADMKKTNSTQGPSTSTSTSTSQATASATNTSQPQLPFAPAADLAAFQKQMRAMSASMPGMQNGVPAMMNPMMAGFNPAMMGMGMNMAMNPGMMGMPGMMGVPGIGMPNFNGMNGNGNGMNGWNGNGNGNHIGRGNWQGNGGGRGGMQAGGGQDSPYMRNPVNPHRQRGRFNKPRSADYRQL